MNRLLLDPAAVRDLRDRLADADLPEDDRRLLLAALSDVAERAAADRSAAKARRDRALDALLDDHFLTGNTRTRPAAVVRFLAAYAAGAWRTTSASTANPHPLAQPEHHAWTILRDFAAPPSFGKVRLRLLAKKSSAISQDPPDSADQHERPAA